MFAGKLIDLKTISDPHFFFLSSNFAIVLIFCKDKNPHGIFNAWEGKKKVSRMIEPDKGTDDSEDASSRPLPPEIIGEY